MQRLMSVYANKVSSLHNVAMLPEVQKALLTWVNNTVGKQSGVLIGGLAMSFYAKPRYTEDVDLLFLVTSDIPDEVNGFKHYRPGAFRDNKHHVDIETVTVESFGTLVSHAIAAKVVKTAIVHEGQRVASREGLIALKLCGAESPKRKLKDLADVQALLEDEPDISMDGWHLSSSHKINLEHCRELAKLGTSDEADKTR